MRRLFSEVSTQQLSVFWSTVIIVGLFVTRWLLILPSIGLAGLFVTGLGYAIASKQIAHRAHVRTFLSLTIVYWVHLFVGLWHNNLFNKELIRDLVLQLPFLLLPVSFLLLPAWRAVHKRLVWAVLIGCCSISAIAATVNYLLHLQEITGQYDRSQVMPTEPDHVRFSILISIAILSGGAQLLTKSLTARWRLAFGLGIGLLFLFQHLLAVRSGLLSLYTAGTLLLLGIGWQSRSWKTVFVSIMLVVGVGLACLWSLPTLQLRIHNTFYDAMQRGAASSANNFSVTARLYSYEIAQTIIQQHPLLGVGKAQLEQEMAQQYSYRYPEISAKNYLLPHNQFVYNLAAYGIIGLIIFFYGFYYPLLVSVRQRNILAIVIYAVITISFLTEYTLENNLGVIIGLFFMLVALTPKADEAASGPSRPILPSLSSVG